MFIEIRANLEGIIDKKDDVRIPEYYAGEIDTAGQPTRLFFAGYRNKGRPVYYAVNTNTAGNPEKWFFGGYAKAVENKK